MESPRSPHPACMRAVLLAATLVMMAPGRGIPSLAAPASTPGAPHPDSIVGRSDAVVPAPAATRPDTPTIDGLYSLPRIIGTAPSGATWSPDSSQVAFLWNDQGREFRDVWMAAVEDPRPARVTAFPTPESEPGGADVEARRRFEEAQQNPGVTAVAWFPDGRHLLATLDGRFHRVGAGQQPESLGAGGRGAAFSPDGGRLAWIDGDDLRVAPVTAAGIGEARSVAGADGEAAGLAGFWWSPDGHRLAVLERDAGGVQERLIPDYLGPQTTVNPVRRAFPGEEPVRSRLLVVDAGGGDARLLELGDDRDLLFSVDWHPDGERLLVDTADLYVKDRQLLSVDVDGGGPTVLVREREPTNVSSAWEAAWAPAGDAALFLSDRAGHYQLYRVDAPGSEPTALTRGDWAVASFHAIADGILLVANREHPSRRDLYRIPAEGGDPERLSERPGTHRPMVSPDGRWAAVHFSSDRVPPDLFLNRLDARGEERLTDSPLPAFHERDWVFPEYVTFPSHVDGTSLHGRLMLPPGHDPARRYPAIIGSIYADTLRNQWGGRDAHPTWGLDQVLAHRGYVLLNVNIRGSWGLGREFRRRMQRGYGTIDVEDVYSGLLYLRSRGDIDMERVGIWGSSYGGLLTVMSLLERPGTFAAGVAGAPATNVWHATTGEMRVMGRPRDHPDAYARSSAFTRAERLQDPLMIIHGMRDRIVLFRDSLVLLERLMLLGKGHLVDFVPLPAAGHGWDAEELYEARYAFRKLVDFFHRHLEPDGGP